MELFLIAVSAVFFAGILLSPVAIRTGAPLLLLFLGIGMLVGEDGPVGFEFDDFELAYDLGSVALAIILFAGGLETDLRDVKKAWAPALMLATERTLTAAQIAGIVQSTARPLPGADFNWRNDSGYGVIDPEACIREAAVINQRVDLDAP